MHMPQVAIDYDSSEHAKIIDANVVICNPILFAASIYTLGLSFDM